MEPKEIESFQNQLSTIKSHISSIEACVSGSLQGNIEANMNELIRSVYNLNNSFKQQRSKLTNVGLSTNIPGVKSYALPGEATISSKLEESTLTQRRSSHSDIPTTSQSLGELLNQKATNNSSTEVYPVEACRLKTSEQDRERHDREAIAIAEKELNDMRKKSSRHSDELLSDDISDEISLTVNNEQLAIEEEGSMKPFEGPMDYRLKVSYLEDWLHQQGKEDKVV